MQVRRDGPAAGVGLSPGSQKNLQARAVRGVRREADRHPAAADPRLQRRDGLAEPTEPGLAEAEQ